MVEKLKGIAASDGVAVAKAYLLVQPDLSFSKVSVSDTDAEEKRLDEALAKSQKLSVVIVSDLARKIVQLVRSYLSVQLVSVRPSLLSN